MRRGDTIVEVLLAFALFALIAVSTTYLMNRSLSIGQRSLEVTQVRQQVDSQAELLRYTRDNASSTGSSTWGAIKSQAIQPDAFDDTVSYSACPSTAPANSFVLRMANPSNLTVSRVPLDGVRYKKASYISRVNYDGAAWGGVIAEGLWITPVRVEGSTSAYDMYIRACWDSVGSSVPQTISTIVRLYDT